MANQEERTFEKQSFPTSFSSRSSLFSYLNLVDGLKFDGKLKIIVQVITEENDDKSNNTSRRLCSADKFPY